MCECEYCYLKRDKYFNFQGNYFEKNTIYGSEFDAWYVYSPLVQKGANHLPCFQRFFLDNQEKRQIKKNLWDQGTNITTQTITPISAPAVVHRMEFKEALQTNGCATKKRQGEVENEMISLEPMTWGFHRLKRFSGLSYICT